MKTKAAVLTAPKTIAIKDVELGACAEDQIIVDLEKATLCPTDIKKYLGSKPDVIEGLEKQGEYVLGHEAAGTIVEVGSSITAYKKGDRVAIQPMVSCGECYYCKNGKSNMCLNLIGVGGSAGKFGDCISFMNQTGVGGCYGSHIKVPGQCVMKLPDNVDFAAGSLVEPLADAVNSIDSAGVNEDDFVVIIGVGPMGLFHVVAARYYKARKIVCVDIDEARLSVARKLGADGVINSSSEDAPARIKEMTDGLGANKIFVTSGGKAQGPCSSQAIDMAAKEGTISLFASAAVDADELTVSMNQIHYNMLNLTGTVGFGRHHGEIAIELLSSGIFDYSVIRNVEFPLEEIEKAISLYGKGEYLKVGLSLK